MEHLRCANGQSFADPILHKPILSLGVRPLREKMGCMHLTPYLRAQLVLFDTRNGRKTRKNRRGGI